MPRKAEEESITELWATTTTPRGAAWATAVGGKIHKTDPNRPAPVAAAPETGAAATARLSM
ncbi:hypothetical protein GCM10022252_24980 [Streptosporangium oxazolinicum]|uniref:Uncharacterized protein n=1 Tax=Streptosporangium oxazolinicum TaxID=909287 RepID=A0ABP8ASI3_9ACTN